MTVYVPIEKCKQCPYCVQVNVNYTDNNGRNAKSRCEQINRFIFDLDIISNECRFIKK